ncbi:MAG: hypothetical protein ABIH35_04260 [Patescibacteria group bacterium]
MRKLLALTAVLTLLAGCTLPGRTEEAPAAEPIVTPEVATPATPIEPESVPESVDDGTPSIPNNEEVPVNADLPAPTAE